MAEVHGRQGGLTVCAHVTSWRLRCCGCVLVARLGTVSRSALTGQGTGQPQAKRDVVEQSRQQLRAQVKVNPHDPVVKA